MFSLVNGRIGGVKIFPKMKPKKKQRHHKKKSNTTILEGKRTNYEFIVPENSNFEKYYKLQKICPEEEWESFMNSVRTHLPSSFRITHSKSEAKAMLELIKGQYFKDVLNAQREEGKEPIEPVALPWYPDNLAWQIQLTRNDIRRSEPFFKLHNFLISETNSGNISRQEVVSMIPPIALDVQPHHKVLDMCAAPGSKTAQLIEYLHKNDRIPEGFVIANDINNGRCYMLVHQAKRLSSPCVMVTNHDATAMPNFLVKSEDGNEEVMKFDRVLCDVPCSGDGTLRKNPTIWPKWSTSQGNNFHGMQFRIAKRGCEMLKVNGRLVYSTCSMNPVENEAVISRLLTEAQGALKLVDLTSTLPGLKFQKGFNSWILASKDLKAFKTYEEVPENLKSILKPAMFPPPEETAQAQNLDRCIRILPHYQDTGAFFIAAIEKVGRLPWECSRVKQHPEPGPEEPQRKKKKFLGYKEDPFVFFSDDEPLYHQLRTLHGGYHFAEAVPATLENVFRKLKWQAKRIRVDGEYGYSYLRFADDVANPFHLREMLGHLAQEFYELSSDLPGNCFLTRCKEGKKKNIYLTSPQMRQVIMTNADKIKIINSGVKAFSRCENKDMTCPFRLAQEGLPSICPYIGPKRKISVTKQDLLTMLRDPSYKKPPEITKLDQATQEKIRRMGKGSCVLVYDEEPVTDTSFHTELVGWIGLVSARAYIPKSEVVHYLRLLGGDTSVFEVNKFKKPQPELDEKLKTELDKSPMDTAD